jgi:ATP-dependent DNA ligase
MRPVAVRELPALPSVMFQPKADGWRVAAFRTADGVDIRTRSNLPRASHFPELVPTLELLPVGTVLDGEVVAWRVVAGRPRMDFGALQASPRGRRGVLVQLLAFDLLADGRLPEGEQDIRRLPLRDRWERLLELLAALPDDHRFTVEPMRTTTDRDEAELWEKALQQAGYEGLVEKKLADPYGRANSWFKRRHTDTVDATVLGGVGPRRMRVRLDDGRELVTEPLTDGQARELAEAVDERPPDAGPLRVELRVGAGRHGLVLFVRVRPDE